MKNTIVALLLLAIYTGCTKDEETFVDDPITTGGTTAFTGNFVSSGGYTSSGSVRVVDSGTVRKLVFENFKTSPGPDLDVYLSTNLSAGSFVNLGNLKATSGNFEYSVDKSVDLKANKHVLIWCVAFGVLFGSAELKMN